MEAFNVKCCPENSLWSSWSGWSVCRDGNTDQIKTCSKEGEAPGTIRRTRTCFPPSCGGNTCSGTDTEVKNCNSFSESPCPIDGNWGEWGPWSECQEDEYEDYGENKNECAGVELKKRNCSNPEPQYGGHDCPGTPIEKKFCKPECAVDCKCGDFTYWGQCDKHCGVCGEKETCQEGMQSRERHCTKEQNGGRTCDAVYGNLIENRTCTIPHCPVDATATPWAEWSPCNPSTGRQNRTRNCIEAKFGGKGCDMPVMEIQSCAVVCQCAGKEWGKWSSCSETCGKGKREKTRVCKAHKNNGRACSNNDASIEFSTKVIEECKNERRCPIIIHSFITF